jgi:Flp pilus assembly protein TadG
MLNRIHTAMIALSRFNTNNGGSVMPAFVIALVPVLALAGAGIDYTHVTNVRNSLQVALDVALLAAAKDGSTDWANVALNSFNANVNSGDASVATPTFTLDANRAYTGSASAAVPIKFGNLLGISSVNVQALGTATMKPSSGNYYCVMALNPTAQAALQLTGNASITITAPKCVLQVNSKDLSAVTMNGNTTIKSIENCFVGGLQKVGNATITPAPDVTCKGIPDPFVKYPRPAIA